MVLDRLNRLTGRIRRELARTDLAPGPAFWGTRESLALGLALIVFGTLGAGLWGLSSAAHDSLLGGATVGASSETASARLVQSAAGTFVYPGGSPALDWPSAGTAAVEVEGYGLMGHSGALDRAVPIASITKTMTAYVVLEDHPLSATQSGPTITLTSAMAAEYDMAIGKGESAVAVRTGERLTERQALEAMMLASAGDMADILAIWDAGSVDAFLVKMNAQARALGMTASRYTDPTGLAASTVSTMADQLKLAEVVQRLPALTSIVAESDAEVPVAGTVHNYNEDLGTDGIDGIKTGTTAAAGSCLLFSAHYTVGGKTVTILGIVLGLAGSTGTPWSALTASRELVSSAEHALGTTTVVPAGQTVALLTRSGVAAKPLGPGQTVRVFGWPGLVFRVTVAGTALAPLLRVTRTGGTGDEVSAVLRVLARPAGSSRSTVRKPESTASASN